MAKIIVTEDGRGTAGNVLLLDNRKLDGIVLGNELHLPVTAYGEVYKAKSCEATPEGAVRRAVAIAVATVLKSKTDLTIGCWSEEELAAIALVGQTWLDGKLQVAAPQRQSYNRGFARR